MEIKDKVSVWAGILTVAVLVAEDRASTELAYATDSAGALVAVVGSLFGVAIGFVIVYSIIKWLLERYFRGKASKPPPSPSFHSLRNRGTHNRIDSRSLDPEMFRNCSPGHWGCLSPTGSERTRPAWFPPFLL